MQQPLEYRLNKDKQPRDGAQKHSVDSCCHLLSMGHFPTFVNLFLHWLVNSPRSILRKMRSQPSLQSHHRWHRGQ